MSDRKAPPLRRRHNFESRPPPEKRGYGTLHRKLRRELLKDSPLCELGCGRPATVADHRKPMCLGGETVPANLAAVCQPCHARKSALEANYVRWHLRPGLARNGRGVPDRGV